MPLYTAMMVGTRKLHKSQCNLYWGQVAVHVYALPSTALQWLLVLNVRNSKLHFLIDQATIFQHSSWRHLFLKTDTILCEVQSLLSLNTKSEPEFVFLKISPFVFLFTWLLIINLNVTVCELLTPVQFGGTSCRSEFSPVTVMLSLSNNFMITTVRSQRTTKFAD